MEPFSHKRGSFKAFFFLFENSLRAVQLNTSTSNFGALCLTWPTCLEEAITDHLLENKLSL